MLVSMLPESVSAAEPDAGISATEEIVSEETPSDNGAEYKGDETEAEASVGEISPESGKEDTETDETAKEQKKVEENVPEETKEAATQAKTKQRGQR